MNRHKLSILLLTVFLIGTAAQAQDTPQVPQQAQPQGRGGLGAEQASQDLLNLIGALQQANTTAGQRGAGGRGARGAGGNPDLVGEIRVITAPVDATTTTVTGRGLLTSPNSGAWWTNTGLMTRLGLTDDQKLKIERVFESNRVNLTTSRENLEKEEMQLSKLLDAETLDRGSVTSQIYKVVQARGDMEKINALMTMEMREVLTRAQWTQLQVQQSVNVTVAGGGVGGRGQRSGGPAAPGTTPPVFGGRGARGQ